MEIQFDRLPLKMEGGKAAPLSHLEALGFKFGDVIDEECIQCTPPIGWKRLLIPCSQWSDIVDDTGAVRGSMRIVAFENNRHASLIWNEN